MKPIAIFAATALLVACSENATPIEDVPAKPESAAEGQSANISADDDQAAQRRQNAIVSWAGNFDITEEQSACIVDNVPWDELIAVEHTPETVAAIEACETDPAKFAGYGR